MAADDPIISVKEGIIREFRENNGRVAGGFEGSPMLILHRVGAKSKLQRVTPLMCWPGNGRYLFIASDRGRDSNPGWFYNFAARPEAQIEVGSEAGIVSLDVIASVLEERGRSTFYAEHAARCPGFAQRQARTERVIPVVALDPRPSPTTR